MARLSVVVAVSLFASMVAAGPVAGQEDTGAGFSDVTGGVHKPAIDALAAMGVFEGTECAEGMFCPDDDMKRWTMGVWLVRVLDEEEPAAVSASSFADVDFEKWWLAHLERLAELEITKGCLVDPLRFCPDESVNRAQMATFLVRAFDLETAEPAGFTDTAGNTHQSNIDALAAARVTAGCATGPLRYCPDRSVTRAQMATFLARALGLVELPPPIEEEPVAFPGAGVSVTAGRADWSSGYFQAELYKLLLEELGYRVSDPAARELGPNHAYAAMARGEIDYWPNSWYPGHLAWLAGGLPDGSLVDDHVTIVGEELLAGGLQGFLVTKSFADQYGVYTMDELNRNAAALAAFDATDSNPGNGVADIFGCPEDWTCDNIIENMIAFSGWDNIVQVTAGYDAMFAQALDNVNEGIPMILYTWTPAAYITQLRPGDNVYWMGVDEILDDSNPANQEGGALHSQHRADGSGGFASIGVDQCPSAADEPSGRCKIGWVAADILVTANSDFLAANPAAEALFEAVKLSVIDVSLANVAMGGGRSPTYLAAQWIADNRNLVDPWLATARAAGPARTPVPVEGPAPDEGAEEETVRRTDVDVIAGRANWSSGYFQAELYKLLLEELGYTVSNPAEMELGPNRAYVAMARGEIDYWPNSWYPGHLAWLAGGLPDGSLVDDHVTIVGEELIAGGLQGFLVTKSFADEYGVYTMDELNRNAAALAAFDATDSNPGNGVADIFGCPEDWTCDNIIENMIAFSGWDNIVQVTAGYDAMFAQALDNVGEGIPMVLYTWTPTSYITQLRPGDNVYWMGVDEILDDSNPANQEGGQEHSQLGSDGSGGFASIGVDQCPSAADEPSGRCKIGWVAADILVTANSDFLAANPAAEALFEAVKLSVIDVSLANVAMGGGRSPTYLAAQWIADNRNLVDQWITAARAAA